MLIFISGQPFPQCEYLMWTTLFFCIFIHKKQIFILFYDNILFLSFHLFTFYPHSFPPKKRRLSTLKKSLNILYFKEL